MPGQRRLSAAHVEPSRDGQTRHVGLAESTPCRLARLGGTVPGRASWWTVAKVDGRRRCPRV